MYRSIKINYEIYYFISDYNSTLPIFTSNYMFAKPEKMTVISFIIRNMKFPMWYW